MCGIFAHYSRKHNAREKLLQLSADNLRHRGPDASSIWISPDRSVGLTHTRLSIIDLRQIQIPIANEENKIFIIANGEFYNHDALRKQLKSSGHRFRTDTDTEIALHLYEEKGMQCLTDLRGEFSFIIWDENIKTLFVVRDRFGIKPLYYSENDGEIYFSSEIPALIKSGAVRAQWDMESLFTFTHFNLHSERTLFQKISQIPPGHYMAVNEYGSRIFQYWDANYPLPRRRGDVSEEDVIQEVRHHLLESVGLRLNSDVNVACYLSGGLDSATLLGMSSEIAGRPLDVFTIGFDDEKVDETDIAHRTASRIGSKVNSLLVSEDDIVNNFQNTVLATCAPIANAAGVARYLLSQFAAKNDYKVVLSGEGADEIFFGYTYMMSEALSDPNTDFTLADMASSKQNPQFFLPVDRTNNENLPKTIQAVEKILGYIPRWVETQGYFNASHRKLLSNEIQSRFATFNPYVNLLNNFNVAEQMQGRNHPVQSVYLWLKSFFPNTMLNWIGDRAEMANSIEARLPFLDHVLFEKVKQIPTALNLKNGVEKHILREAAKPYITDEIYKRQKFMFQAPAIKLEKKNKQFELMCDLIITEADSLYMYDKKKLLKFVDEASQAVKSNFMQCFDVSTTLTTIASIAILNRGYAI